MANRALAYNLQPFLSRDLDVMSQFSKGIGNWSTLCQGHPIL